MNPRAPVIVAAGLVMILGIFTAILWRELQTARETTAERRSELAKAMARVAVVPVPSVEADIQAPEPVPTTTPAPAAPVGPARPGKPEATATVTSGREAFVGGVRVDLQALLDDPEFRNASLAALSASTARAYPGLAEELGLTTEEADRLFALLAESQLEMSSQLTAVASSEGEPDEATRSELRRRRQALQHQQNEALRTMLGEARYAQWREYQRTRPVRAQATSHANALSQAGSPLNSAQFQTLMSAMVAEEQDMQREILALARTVNQEIPETRQQAQEALQRLRDASNRRVLDAAASRLDAQQLALLRTQIEQQDAINDAAARFRDRAETSQSP